MKPERATIRFLFGDAPQAVHPPAPRRHGQRRGGSSWPLLAAVATRAILGLLIASLVERQPGPVATETEASSAQPPLLVYCAASNREVLEAVVWLVFRGGDDDASKQLVTQLEEQLPRWRPKFRCPPGSVCLVRNC